MTDFTEPSDLFDLEIVLKSGEGTQSLYYSKYVLTKFSEYFKGIFTGSTNMVEKITNRIEFVDIDYDIFLLFLKTIDELIDGYPTKNTNIIKIGSKAFLNLLELSDRFLIEMIKHALDRNLTRLWSSYETDITELDEAELIIAAIYKYNLVDTLQFIDPSKEFQAWDVLVMKLMKWDDERLKKLPAEFTLSMKQHREYMVKHNEENNGNTYYGYERSFGYSCRYDTTEIDNLIYRISKYFNL